MESEELNNKLLEIADLFYKGKYDIGSQALNLVLPTIARYAEGLSADNRDAILREALVPLLGAMEDQNGILIADVINYEILQRI